MTARAVRKSVAGEDWWCLDYQTYVRNLLKSTVADSEQLIAYLAHYRAFAERHGKDWPTFLHDEMGGATPELLDAIAQVAKGGKGGKGGNGKETAGG